MIEYIGVNLSAVSNNQPVHAVRQIRTNLEPMRGSCGEAAVIGWKYS